jgi:hypothetical protein
MQLLDASLMEEYDFKNWKLGCSRLTHSFAWKSRRSGLKLAIKCLHNVLNDEHARSGWTLHEVTGRMMWLIYKYHEVRNDAVCHKNHGEAAASAAGGKWNEGRCVERRYTSSQSLPWRCSCRTYYRGSPTEVVMMNKMMK